MQKDLPGYNMFAWGTKAALDIVLPILDEETREEVKEKIEDMIRVRKYQKEN